MDEKSTDAILPRDIYLIFDVLPTKTGGGLVATYANFVELYRDEFDIHLVSIFKPEPNDIPEFEGVDIITLFDKDIDNRFFRLPAYLKAGEFDKAGRAARSLFSFFDHMPLAKRQSLERFKESIVIATSPAASMFLSRHLPYVLEVHTTYDYFWGSNPIGRMQGALVPEPALVLFRTQTDARKGSSRFPSGYLYNFVKDRRKSAQPDFAKRKNRILFMGRLSNEKNPLMVLDAAERLRGEIPSVVIDVYGDGPLFATMEREIKSRGLCDSVTLKGFVDDKVIYDDYSLLWVTSKYEGLPLAIVEAMNQGVPTVSSQWGDAACELIDGSNGLVCQDAEGIADASRRLLTDQNALEDASFAARRTYESNFTENSYRLAWRAAMESVYGKEGQ